jgi:hypothetical protein
MDSAPAQAPVPADQHVANDGPDRLVVTRTVGRDNVPGLASGCCAGVDQISFDVPSGVSGCYVPVAAVTNGVVSNFGTISVAALATTEWVARHLPACSDTDRVVLPGLCIGDVEVEPAVVLVHGAARDRVGKHGGKEVQRGVHAHAPVARAPVELERHIVSNCRALAHGLRRHMRDLGFELIIVDGGRERKFTGGCYEHSAVAWLPARGRVEAGAIDHDAALLGEPEYGRWRRSQVRVFAEQAVGGHSSLHVIPGRARGASPESIATNLNS